MVDDGRTDGGRTDDGRTTEHGYTISSPCEPDGSGELKMGFVMTEPDFYLSKNKDADQLISAFDFASRTVQLPFFLNLKFQESNLFSSVQAGPCRTRSENLRPAFWCAAEIFFSSLQ